MEDRFHCSFDSVPFLHWYLAEENMLVQGITDLALLNILNKLSRVYVLLVLDEIVAFA